MRNKTINSFLSGLPEGVKPAIIELWASANVLDLNYGCLANYILVINERFQQTKSELERAEDKLKELRKLL